MAKQQTVVTLAVKMVLPTGVKAGHALDYVREALYSHKGGMDPELPITEMNNEEISVNLIKKETTYG